MPGKAKTSVSSTFWGGKGNCWAAQGEPGPARTCVPVWAGTCWEHVLSSTSAKAQGPRPSPSSCCERRVSCGELSQTVMSFLHILLQGLGLFTRRLFTLPARESQRICTKGCAVTPAVI